MNLLRLPAICGWKPLLLADEVLEFWHRAGDQEKSLKGSFWANWASLGNIVFNNESNSRIFALSRELQMT